MNSENAKDLQDLWTMAVQGVLLAVGFAFAFLWDADLAPRALSMLILILLVVQYPMADRLKDVLLRELLELRKANGITQVMLARILDLLPGGFADSGMSPAEELSKATELAKQLEGLQVHFEKGFSRTYEVAPMHRVDLIINTFGVVFYLAMLIGGAAFVGWLISLAF